MKLKKYYFIITSIMLLMVACQQSPLDKNTLDFKHKQVDAIAQLLSTKPDSAGLRLIYANKLDSIGRYRLALLQMDTLLAKDSTKYGLWLIKSNILLDSGRVDLAKQGLTKAISIYPGKEALLQLAELYVAEHNDSCMLVAKRFNKEDKLYVTFISGLLAVQKNETTAALAKFDSCILQNYQFVKAYIEKGKILNEKGDRKAALATFNKGLEYDKYNTALLNNIAYIYVQTKQLDSAKAIFAKSLSIKPFQPKIDSVTNTLKLH